MVQYTQRFEPKSGVSLWTDREFGIVVEEINNMHIRMIYSSSVILSLSVFIILNTTKNQNSI